MRMPNVPPALRWLVAAVALAGVAWTLVVPAWQVPDEDAHFAYVQTLVELRRRPADDGRPAVEAGKSTEQDLAEESSGFLDSAQRIDARPQWSTAAERRWIAEQRALGEDARENGGGASPAQGNPPGYYLYAALPYLAARSGTILDRLYLMRLLSVPLLCAFALSGWLLAGELLRRDRAAQLICGAVCGLAPMATFVGSAVTPDALLFPLWGMAFWLSVRVVRHGARARDLAWLIGVTAAAVAVKLVSVALLPGVVWALATWAWRRSGRPVPPARLVAAGLAGAGALAPVVALAAAAGGPRRFLSYLWQFYSPVQAGTEPVPQLASWPLRDVWLEGTVGAFGWLEVRFPGWVYALAAVAAAVVAVLAARALVAAGPRRHAVELVALALPALALVAGLHLSEEWFLVNEDEAFAQGRYLLPLLPLAGLGCALAVRALAPRGRGPALGGLLGILATGQLAALALVTARFYA